MTDEELNNVSSEQVGQEAIDFVNALNQKNASIQQKDQEIAKLKAEKGYLINQMANNISPEAEVVEDGPSKTDLENILVNGEHSNLEVITASLKHRQMVLDTTGKDEYAASVSKSGKYDPHATQVLEANDLAEKLQELVDQANGDPDIFDTLLKKAVGPKSKFIK